MGKKKTLIAFVLVPDANGAQFAHPVTGVQVELEPGDVFEVEPKYAPIVRAHPFLEVVGSREEEAAETEEETEPVVEPVEEPVAVPDAEETP